MMYKIMLIIILFTLTGCNPEEQVGWRKEMAPQYYRCTSPQLALVEHELKICSETGYFTDYCFAQAKSIHCTDIRIKEVSQ